MVQINDIFKYLDEFGRRRTLKIVNISLYREPDMKYAVSGYDKVAPTSETITIEVEDNVINFYYTAKEVNYTVN